MLDFTTQIREIKKQDDAPEQCVMYVTKSEGSKESLVLTFFLTGLYVGNQQLKIGIWNCSKAI